MDRRASILIISYSLILTRYLLLLCIILLFTSCNSDKKDFTLIPEKIREKAVDGLSVLGILKDEIIEKDKGRKLIIKLRENNNIPFIKCNFEITKKIREIGGETLLCEENDNTLRMKLGYNINIPKNDSTERIEVLEITFIRERQRLKITKEKKLSLIIAGLGKEKDALVNEFLALPIPLGIAILPYKKFSKEIAIEASGLGKDVILHLPMEPAIYPKEKPGKGTIYVDMKQKEIKKIFSDDLKWVPNACGVANYMGGRATQDKLLMQILLKEIKEKNLFFLDSMTSPNSIGYELAEEMEVPSFRRSSLIIKGTDEEIERLKKIAEKEGKSLGIVRPTPSTLQALRKHFSIPETSSIKLVLPSEIVKQY